MCRKLVSCADFKAILTPFSGVVWNRYSSFWKNGKADHSIHRWSEVTPQIAFSSKGKVPNRNKTNSSLKPNKFHSKPVYFSVRKNREEQKNCLTICLFGFPEVLVMGSATMAICKVVSSSTLIGPFTIWARAQIQRPLVFMLKFKWANQGWGWNHHANSRCRGPHHKNLRKAEEANFKAIFSFFTILRDTFEVGKLYFKWDSDLHNFFLRSAIFPYNSLYTQAFTYTTYFELGEPVVNARISVSNL